MEENKESWLDQHQDNVATAIAFAVFSAGLGWVIGRFGVSGNYTIHYLMAVALLLSISYVVSDGVEVAIRRMMCNHSHEVTVETVPESDKKPDDIAFSGE